MTKTRLFSIPPGAAFLPTFIEALLAGEIIEDFIPAQDNPLALANMTIYVPTQRAARALRSGFVERHPLQSSFLPTIRALGDVDEDENFFSFHSDIGLQLAPPIDVFERQLILARLIQPWRENLPHHVRSVFGSEDVTIPASAADAVWLAADLAHLIDEMDREEADWKKLVDIAPDDVAEWWQVTLDFLTIVGNVWPGILKEKKQSNPAAWKTRALHLAAKRIAENPPRGPVIALGSTGSVPATALLLKAIADSPRGAVILPGLDRDMDGSAWQILGFADRDPALFGHPQYGLKKLLDIIGVGRDDVIHLGHVSKPKRQREKLISEALRPADATDQWAALGHADDEGAFDHIALVEAASEREEALAIALALRQAIEMPDKTAALITSDRTLARRVSSELKRFGIEADDSGGQPLLESSPLILMRLLLSVVFQPGDPVAFLSLLKHPLVTLGLERADLREKAERFERVFLRGGTGNISVLELHDFIKKRLERIMADSRLAAHAELPQAVEEAQELVGLLIVALAPLIDFANKKAVVSVNEAVTSTVATLENVSRSHSGSLDILYHGEAGQALIALMRKLLVQQSQFTFNTDEWPDIITALLAGQAIQKRGRGHPRLFIWGGLEARLQTVDTVVIGALNEGRSPASGRNDPFMSRMMKMSMGLEPPERRIGLAAHDFQMAMGADRLILSRALRMDNAPAVASRWLQRIETVLGSVASAALRQRGRIYLDWARQIDQAADRPFALQPCPRPPLASRPSHFSVTEIETLRRDPYAIYARRILGLKPLDDLIRAPSAAERGTLYHDIIAHYVTSQDQKGTRSDYDYLIEIARAQFDNMQLPLDIEAIWWPRFSVLAKNYLIWENARSVKTKYAEIGASPVMIGATDITLSGRADRIDALSGGGADIIDFKTGSSPSLPQAAHLLAPQLALEGALLQRGGFADCGAMTPDDLLYVRLTSRGEVYQQSVPKAAKKSAAELSEESWRRLEELITLYSDESQGYLSRALPMVVSYEDDYEHLARVLEWSSAANAEVDQ